MHEVESLVDVLEAKTVRDERIDLYLSVHVPVDDLRNIGAAARAAEGGAFPDAAGDQLERTGGDFLAGLGDADDRRNAPATIAAFQRRALSRYCRYSRNYNRRRRGKVENRLTTFIADFIRMTKCVISTLSPWPF